MTVTFELGYFIKIWVCYFKILGEINLVRTNNTVEPRYNEHGLYQIHRYRTINQLFVTAACFALSISSFFKTNLISRGIEARSLGHYAHLPLISSFAEAMFYHEQRVDTNNFTSHYLHVFVLIRKATH